MTGPTGEGVVAPLGDLGRYVVEFAFGDIYSRDGLGLREREIVTITSLVVLARDGRIDGIIHLHDLWRTEMV